ncbi:MAG: hypothetical protein KA795_05890 [Burkholderiaceae bacterium]|nr:hypothetical protein [Burkholderiaceae bacterium]
MKIFATALVSALLLTLGTAHAQDASKPDPRHLKRLNACNKEAKGKADDAYREAMKSCMERKKKG